MRTFGILRVRELGVILAAVVVALFFQTQSPKFLSVVNLGTLLNTAAELGIVTVGVVFLMISGEFDLSVSGPFALSPEIAALLIMNYNFDRVAAIFIGLAFAALIGFSNGILVTKTGIPSFIITLGTGFLLLGTGLLLSPLGIVITGPTQVETILNGWVGPVRAEVLWFAGFAILFWIILDKTKYGNWVFATGGNANAALMAGIPIARVKIANFVICSLLAGFSGIASMSRLLTTYPLQGQSMPLQAIAASVIGGTSLFGGIGSVVGGALGAIITGMITVGLSLMGVSVYWNYLFIGSIIIIVVAVNVLVIRGAIRSGGSRS